MFSHSIIDRTALKLAVAAVGTLTALAAGGPAFAAAPATAQGKLDADLRSDSGRLLGVVHGSLSDAGGLLTLTPHDGVARAPQILHAEVRRAGGEAIVTAAAPDVRLELRIDASERLRGSGRIDGRRVRARGAGGEAPVDLQRGMRMLVVGHPEGEGYAALRKEYRMVRYRPSRHSRERLLRDRDAFRSYAGVVFGQDISARQIRAHGLLRSFYGAGKWVVAARATPKTAAALGEVHPYNHGRAAPALAVRQTGPAGDTQRVKPTIAYPVLGRADAAKLTPDVRRRAAAERERWFRGQLRRYSAAHMRAAPRAGRTLKASNTTFSLPVGAAAIEIKVPFEVQDVLEGGANAGFSGECLWNRSTWRATCPESPEHQKILTDMGLDGASTAERMQKVCERYLGLGYWTLDPASAGRGKLLSTGVWETHDENITTAFVRRPGDRCPRAATQLMQTQGEDEYYALYDGTVKSTPDQSQHTIIALTDPTVTAAVGGSMGLGGELSTVPDQWINGTGWIYKRNLHFACTRCQGYWQNDSTWATQPERAWFLSRYQHRLALSGPNVGTRNFEYRGTLSTPQNAVTFAGNSTGISETKGFNVGVFGTDPTLGVDHSTTVSTDVSVNVPDWEVSPLVNLRSIEYDWRINTPVSWQTIASEGSGTWQLNPLAVNDFNPASLTTWRGDATYGPVSIASTRTLTYTDHYSWFNGTGMGDFFVSGTSTYDMTPDARIPDQGKSATPNAPGINLCDAAVMNHYYATDCAK